MTRARIHDAPWRDGRPVRRDAHHRDRLYRCIAFAWRLRRDARRARVREDEGAIADRLTRRRAAHPFVAVRRRASASSTIWRQG